MAASSTVGEILQEARQALEAVSQTPALDAQVLLAECQSTTRTWILAHPEAVLDTDRLRGFRLALGRCLAGEALPYVLGWWEFYGRRFRLSREVLIPRPETELLVESGLEYLRSHPGRRRALDVGTGSGCLAVSLAAEVPDLRVLASDIDLAPLRLARQNAQQHGVADRTGLVQADLAGPLGGWFDLITANLPYIPRSRLSGLDVARREPRRALDGGPGGIEVLSRLIAQLPGRLAPGGRALLEIDASQGTAVLDLVRGSLPEAAARIHQDLAGNDRMVAVERPG